jgi:SAM-dependent MidA family methyltransferase
LNSLFEIITRAMRDHGVISFARFMELALYCPVYGYYEKERDTVGRRGDFYTNVSVGSLFGELLACQFAEWLAEVRSPEREWRLVEAGAHDGQLAKDIVLWLRRWRPELYHALQYVIVEPSSRRQEWQKDLLREFGNRIRWVAKLNELAGEGVHGTVFSNELFDAMPVHRLGWDALNRIWFEWGVTVRNGRFAWVRMEGPGPEVRSARPRPCPADDAAPLAYPELPAALLNVLPDGYTTEVCPAAADWWREAAALLRRGQLLTIDYGLVAREWFAAERKEGTLRAYSRHHAVRELLANAGDQDLTAHVDFSALQSAGEAAGLKTESFVSQATFLTQIAGRIWQGPAGRDAWTPEHSRQFQTLTHPEHLGRPFHVLVQSRS